MNKQPIKKNNKKKHEAKLILANNKLIFHYQEKENLTAELLIANKELAFQYHEKE